ncbi:MAG: hypothetical protein WDO24_05070 [Pseudomonadota bacterium]
MSDERGVPREPGRDDPLDEHGRCVIAKLGIDARRDMSEAHAKGEDVNRRVRRPALLGRDMAARPARERCAVADIRGVLKIHQHHCVAPRRAHS